MKTFFGGVLIYSCFLISCQSGDQDQATHSHDHHEHHDHEHDHHDHEHHDHDHNHDHNHDDHNHDDHDHEHEHDHEHKHEHDHHDLEDGQVELSQQQFKRLGLAVQKIAVGPFHQIIKSAGRLEAPTGQERVITASSSGILTFAKKELTQGAPLRQGEVIAYVSDKNLADGDQISRIQLELSRAEAEFERAQQLMRDSLISMAEFNQIRNQYETARLASQTVSGQTSDRGVAVSSQIAGYVQNILVVEGSYVSAGQAIATVGSSKQLRLRTDLPERYAAELHLIQTANFRTASGEQVYDLSQMNGRLLSFARSLDPVSLRLPVYFEFDHTGHLVPGSFVEVFLKTQTRQALTLPLEALIEEQGLYAVYVQEEPTIYRKIPVEIGATDGQRVEILSGLKPGMPIVTQGAYYLKLASMSSAIPHGHAH